MRPATVKAACARCNKVQNTADMRITYVGVYVCFDKSRCPGMKAPPRSL